MIRTLSVIAALSAFGLASPALAGDFATLDTDGSGGLSLAEVQAAAPEVTEEEFAGYDVDESGELSEVEFDAWKASKTEE